MNCVSKYYQDKPKLNSVYSRDNLPKIKDGVYVINLDEHFDIGTHWVPLYVQNIKNFIYFDCFGVEHIPKEVKVSLHNKNITTNIFRLQAYNNFIMCGYFCNGFIDFMLMGKTLTEYTNLFSPNNLKKNDSIILNYFISNI